MLRLTYLLAGLALAGTASAADLVFFTGDAREAIEHVAADAARPIWTLEPVRLGEQLTGTEPVVLGGEQSLRCAAKPTTIQGLRSLLGRAEKRVGAEQFVEASQDLSHVTSGMYCLVAAAEPSLGSRAFFLQGLVAGVREDEDGAQRAYARALDFEPDLVWDESYPPDWAAPFKAAQLAHKQEPATGSLVLGVGLDSLGALWIDGRMVTVRDQHVTLPAGEHLVQILDPKARTVALQVYADATTTLLIPAQVPDALVTQVSDDAQRGQVDALLRLARPDAPTLFVWTGTQTWQRAEDWVLLESAPLAMAQAPIKHGTPMGLGDRLVTGGVAGAAVGVLATGVGLAFWLPNAGATQAAGEDTATFTNRVRLQYFGRGTAYTGLAALGGGAVALGVGLGLSGKFTLAPTLGGIRFTAPL